MRWAEEWSLIADRAEHYGIDARFIGAIRRVCAGGTYEFGVTVATVRSYGEQLDTCCAWVRNLLDQYGSNPFWIQGRVPQRLAYREAFIQLVGESWMRGDRPEDCHRRDEWITAVQKIYRQLILLGALDRRWGDLE